MSGTFRPQYRPDTQPDTIYAVPVTGQVTGNSLELSGVSLPFPLNPGSVYRLLAFTATRDPIGRLAGTLTWEDDWVGRGTEPLLNRKTRSGDIHEVVQIE